MPARWPSTLVAFGVWKSASRVERGRKRDERDEREHLNLVFIGHVDAGKSTFCGQILYQTDQVDARTIEKYEKEAKEKNRDSWFLAFLYTFANNRSFLRFGTQGAPGGEPGLPGAPGPQRAQGAPGGSQGSLGPQAPWCPLEPPGSLPQTDFTLPQTG